MKKIFLAVLVCMILAPLCAAQEHKEPPPHTPTSPVATTALPAGWIRYNSPEGRYKVVLPTQPKLSTQPSKTADGVSFLQYMASSTTDKEAFLVGYFDRMAGSTFSFDRARDGFVSAVNGTLINENPITLQGLPGRELRVEGHGNDGESYILRVRIINTGDRIYVVQFIVGSADADIPIEKQRAAQYFDSFQVSQ